MDRLTQVFDRIRRSEAVEAKNVDQLAQALLSLVHDERDAAISSILGSEAKGQDIARSGVNIAILSVVIARRSASLPTSSPTSPPAPSSTTRACSVSRIPS